MNTAVAFDVKGNLTSLLCGNRDFAELEKVSGLFVLQLRDIVGNPIRLKSEQFRECTVTSEGQDWQLCYGGCREIPSLQVVIRAKRREDGVHWRLQANGLPDFLALEWADYPKLPIRRSPSMALLLPYCEGLLIDDVYLLEQNTFGRNEYLEFPLRGNASYYPGTESAQFLAVVQDNTCLYVACEDSAHTLKSLEIAVDTPESFRLVLQQYACGKNTFDYEVITSALEGDWYEAAERYRGWMKENDRTLPAPLPERIPGWLAEGPVILALPIKGEGLDAGSVSPNEYYPYENVAKLARTYHEKLNAPVLALLMHWEGTAPWAPPYIWPPYGGEEQMRDFIAEMHRDGNLVGLYASGIGWTQQSMIEPSYARTVQFKEEHLEEEMCRGPRQELHSAVCNGLHGQRLGYDLCASRKFTADVVCSEIEKAASAGVDYLQFFDQNPGGSAPMCYAWHHDHPAWPGPWMAENMAALLQKAGKAAGRTVLGCEYAAAEPFMKACRLNDLRGHLNWSYGRPVPLHQFLFHEYSWGFSGNAIGLNQMLDTEATPGLLLWYLAWHFAAGNLLTVVMKEHGQIHWCWVNSWRNRGPEQEPICTLLANLAALRKGILGEIFLHGRMEKLPKLTVLKRDIVHLDKRVFKLEAVLCSAWSWQGRRAILLVNSLEKTADCSLEIEARKARLITTDSETGVAGGRISVSVPPLHGAVIVY